MDLAFCGAMIDSSGDGPSVYLTTNWLIWGTYADDYFPAVFGRTRDMAGAKLFHERLGAFMPLDGAASALVPMNPVELGLADAWSTTATCRRYEEVELRYYSSPGHVRGHPTGLGTAASRMAELLRGASAPVHPLT